MRHGEHLPVINCADLTRPHRRAPLIALALHARNPVMTGNAKHFPEEAGVAAFTPATCVAAVASG